MSVLVYAESEKGQLKKIALELASFGRAIADQLNTDLIAITVNCDNNELLGNYGVNEILTSSHPEEFNAQQYAAIVKDAAQKKDAKVIAVSSSADSRYLAPLAAVELNAGYVTNVVEAPLSTTPFHVKRSVFTNKAFGISELNTDVKMVGLSKNAFGMHENPTTPTVTEFSPTVNNSSMEIASVDKANDQVTIAALKKGASGSLLITTFTLEALIPAKC